MKNLWNIVYYETSNGECPVEEFIHSKNPRNQAKLLAFISLLEERGPNLPRPYADVLGDGIHELRVKISGHQIRMFYFFCYQNMIVLTHALTKITQKVPSSEIKTAQRYREDFLKRFNQERV